MDKCYLMKMADIEFRYKFYAPDTNSYFRDFILEPAEEGFDLETTGEDMTTWAHLAPCEHTDAFLEQRIMILKLSAYLCRKHACVIHACALVWKGFAWLFTAPSGTGKTTLYLNWKRLLGDEVMILNGDMPFVLARPGKEVWVCPSPWNGKENYGSLARAPLGGILFLSQGRENVMARMGIPEAVALLYSRFICISDSEKTVRCLSEIEERILETVPVWDFKNRGDLSSALVSSREIKKYLEEKKLWKDTD